MSVRSSLIIHIYRHRNERNNDGAGICKKGSTITAAQTLKSMFRVRELNGSGMQNNRIITVGFIHRPYTKFYRIVNI